ncbi:MAG: hypothetical protein SFW64_08135 [Alphaproteobacteria bacterium]|nr:hypothetical protein [Alphaproteobacteria bacterium]
MTIYQDLQTGRLHEFDEGVDPFKLNVSCYNPLWIGFIAPYSHIISDDGDKLNPTLDEINNNSYNGKKLSEAVLALPLKNSENEYALISYDGGIALPRNNDFAANNKAFKELSKILCALLLGGVHVEAVYPHEVYCGSLSGLSNDLFCYASTRHSLLRHNWASLVDRALPLTSPRFLYISDLKKAYDAGSAILDAIPHLTPSFLLYGYTAMIYNDPSDALANFWVVVEQLTSKIRGQNPSNLKSSPSISKKHEILKENKVISEDCFGRLNSARKERNNLMHKGEIPNSTAIQNVWYSLHDLLEIASKISPLGMRNLVPTKQTESSIVGKIDLDEWYALTKQLSDPSAATHSKVK